MSRLPSFRSRLAEGRHKDRPGWLVGWLSSRNHDPIKIRENPEVRAMRGMGSGIG
ncbi:MAG: hypothetical protein OES09_02820 [Gammaproteobacteria bacterium]|nr:hypothetical protein [Gammaproteobacteria bacterium]